MTRTQVQFPDSLYRDLTRVAREREMTLAEVIRRGAEYITQVYQPLTEPRAKWKLPGPFDLGVRGDPFADPDWRYEVNIGETVHTLVREKKAAAYGRKSRKRA
jgi:hypothetical protein